jgi:hypothetical protein
MSAINRRAFVVGLATIPIVGLQARSLADIPGHRSTQLMLVAQRRIGATSNKLSIRLPESLRRATLVLRTTASGYWLYSVDVIEGGSLRMTQVIGRRLLPNANLALTPHEATGPDRVTLLLHHAYLPLSPERAMIEVWADTT